MAKIALTGVGKRYITEWIFRKVTTDLTTEQPCAILGSNGSGKSTLLQIISGYVIPTEGTIEHSVNGKVLEQERCYQHVSIAAPYLELIEDYTLPELIAFHGQFKQFRGNLSASQVIEIMQLEKAANKPIKNFSSGMKQRAKLGLAILSDTEYLLLDEPTSNLDKEAIGWYQNLMAEYGPNRLIVVCSNRQEHEYAFCTQFIELKNYKP